MAKKKEQATEVAELTIQADNVTIETERNGDPAGAKAMLPEDVAAFAEPEMEEVKTGKHIITGEPVTRKVPAKKAPVDYATDDRREFEVAKAITGSLNGRTFDLKPGDKVHMNGDEMRIFKPYLK